MSASIASSDDPAIPDPTVVRRAVFRLRGVSKSYVNGEVRVEALKDIDLALYESEFIVLLGASGSRKSTLPNILGGLDVPSAGTLPWLDHDLTDASDRELMQQRLRSIAGIAVQLLLALPFCQCVCRHQARAADYARPDTGNLSRQRSGRTRCVDVSLNYKGFPRFQGESVFGFSVFRFKPISTKQRSDCATTNGLVELVFLSSSGPDERRA